MCDDISQDNMDVDSVSESADTFDEAPDSALGVDETFAEGGNDFEQFEPPPELPHENEETLPEGPVLARDQSELWQAGNEAIDATLDAIRDDLIDKNTDEAEIDRILAQESADMMQELSRNIEGDFSDPYLSPFERELLSEQAEPTLDDIGAQEPDFSESSDVPPAETADAAPEVDEILNADGNDFEQFEAPPELPPEIQETLPETEEPVAERVFDEFEQSLLESRPDFREAYDAGSFYEQGINEYGFEGTCGPTSQANTLNQLFGSNEFTENKILGVAVDNGLCNTGGSPDICGSTTTSEFVELYGKINEQMGDKIQTELYEYEDALGLEDMAAKLDEGAMLNVAVDACALWGIPRDYSDPMGGYSADFASDHWITVTGCKRDETGAISGFDIIDSGGGVNYVSADQCQQMCFGTPDHRVLDPTCIAVRRK